MSGAICLCMACQAESEHHEGRIRRYLRARRLVEFRHDGVFERRFPQVVEDVIRRPEFWR